MNFDLLSSLIFCKLIECPSIYEMLPNPDFKWEKQPEILVWRKKSKDGNTVVKLERYDASTSVTLFEEALKSNEVYLLAIFTH